VRNYELYRGGAERIRKGWARRAWRNKNGGVCLVQSLFDEGHMRVLHPQQVAEIDAHLNRKYPSYRALKIITARMGLDPFDTIIAWNDFAGTQERVAEALDTLADELELKQLREAHARLEAKVEELKARVLTLETENSKLRRLTNSAALRADRHELAQLERELDKVWDRLSLATSQ
jgi:predicted nuclease with TOPRIM domain